MPLAVLIQVKYKLSYYQYYLVTSMHNRKNVCQLRHCLRKRLRKALHVQISHGEGGFKVNPSSITYLQPIRRLVARNLLSNSMRPDLFEL